MNRILFVDDEPNVLAALRRLFGLHKAASCAVYFAEGGAEALEAMAARPFDVVVSDFRMPGIDGTQFLCEVRRRHPETVRLVLSGWAEERGLVQMADLAHQFIPKGCDPKELIGTLDLPLRLGARVGDHDMLAALAGIGTLPSSRSSIRDLLAVTDSPRCSAGSVAESLQRDVGLAAKVLQLVNSAFFAPRARITSLEDAVVRLGVQTIRSVVAESPVHGLGLTDPAAEARLESLNDHALATARLARRLAPPEHAGDAFCAGLLHECGALAVAVDRPELLLPPPCPHDGTVEVGEQALATAGAYLLSLWGLPPEVLEAIARHADPVEIPSGERPDLTTSVQIAHLVAESERPCSCGKPRPLDLDDAWLEAAGVLDEIRRGTADRAGARSGLHG